MYNNPFTNPNVVYVPVQNQKDQDPFELMKNFRSFSEWWDNENKKNKPSEDKKKDEGAKRWYQDPVKLGMVMVTFGPIIGGINVMFWLMVLKMAGQSLGIK